MSTVYERIAEELGLGSDPLSGDTPADKELAEASDKWIVSKQALGVVKDSRQGKR